MELHEDRLLVLPHPRPRREEHVDIETVLGERRGVLITREDGPVEGRGVEVGGRALGGEDRGVPDPW